MPMDKIYCEETEKEIVWGMPVFAGIQDSLFVFFHKFCKEAIGHIPEENRRKNRCEEYGGDDKGLDIFTGSLLKETETGNLYFEFYRSKEKFLFSISEEAVEKYLPKHYLRRSPFEKSWKKISLRKGEENGNKRIP